jgi:hypothetical protein
MLMGVNGKKSDDEDIGEEMLDRLTYREGDLEVVEQPKDDAAKKRD